MSKKLKVHEEADGEVREGTSRCCCKRSASGGCGPHAHEHAHKDGCRHHHHHHKPAHRGALIGLGVVDAALRVVAIVDLVKRPQDEVRGPKAAWGVALAVVNSVGVVPGAYLLWGRITK